jgi:Kdo2-lipid IVA lauroyltransferase/acyltransferase
MPPARHATLKPDMVAVNELAGPSPEARLSLAERRDLGLYRVMRSLPVPVVSRLGAGLGQILGRRAHPAEDARVVAALRHLRCDFAENPAALKAAQTRLWANVGRVYAEFCVLHKIVPEGRVSIDDPGTLDAVVADGRPVIVPFVHLGNWETSAIQIVYRAPGRVAAMAAPPPRNRVRARIAAMQRGRLPGKVLTVDGNVWRRALHHLEQPGGILIVAVDELGADGVSVPSMGRALEAPGNLGKLVRLAARTGAIILPLYNERLAGATFVTRLMAPLELARTLKMSAEEHRHHVARLDALYGPVVLRLIDQWFGLLLWR